MPRKKRLEAQPIDRILDRETRQVVGWLYLWNTGDLVPKWKDGIKTDVVYEGGGHIGLETSLNKP